MFKTFFLIFLLFCFPLVTAVETIENQKNIIMTVERGKEYTFYLILKNVNESFVLSSSGDASKWITFGDENMDNYEITNLINQSVKISIFVPGNAETRKYTANILADDFVLSQIEISVVDITNTINEISKRLEILSKDVENLKIKQKNIEIKTENLVSKTHFIMNAQNNITSLTKDIEKMVSDFFKYIKSVNEIEEKFKKEKEGLLKKINDLENKTSNLRAKNEELMKLTGKLTFNYSSISFFIGLIFGIIIISVFSKGWKFQHILRGFKSKLIGFDLKMYLKGLTKMKRKKYRYIYNK